MICHLFTANQQTLMELMTFFQRVLPKTEKPKSRTLGSPKKHQQLEKVTKDKEAVSSCQSSEQSNIMTFLLITLSDCRMEVQFAGS